MKAKVLFIFLVIIFGFSTACKKKEAPLSVKKSHEVFAAKEALRGESVYLLDIPLTDQDSNKIRWDVFKGKKVVVSLFYGSCPYTCPLLFGHFKKLEKRLDPLTLENTRFLMLSMDPEKDTPLALKELTVEQKIDTTRWKVATTPENQVQEIAAVLGVQYQKLPDGNFNHTSLITLLDRDGKIIAQFDGINPPIEEIALRLKEKAK